MVIYFQSSRYIGSHQNDKEQLFCRRNKIINSGGRISREYGLGRKRTDLFIEWPTNPKQSFTGPVQRIVIELKIQRGHLKTLLPEALKQTAEYASTVGADEAHLIVFNRNPNINWDEKIWRRLESWNEMQITTWGC